MRRIFRQCGSTALQKSHLPVANRYSLPFSARQKPRPPILLSSLVPRPSSRQKSALRFRVINRLKSAAWFGLGCIVNLKNSLLDCWDGEGRDGG